MFLNSFVCLCTGTINFMHTIFNSKHVLVDLNTMHDNLKTFYERCLSSVDKEDIDNLKKKKAINYFFKYKVVEN